MLAAIATMPALAACDPVTYGEVVIESKAPLDMACFTRVEQELSAVSGVKVAGSLTSSRQVQVTRGSDDISVILESSTPTVLRLSFKWLGRSPAEDERGHFALLDEVQAMLTRSCAVKESDISVRRACSARLCRKWLGETGG